MVGPGAVSPVIFYRAAELRGGASALPSPARRARKSFTRRGPDHTPFIRRTFQLAFLALNVAIGVQFWLFVRFFESGGTGFVRRPPGVEGWLPIAALMNLKAAVLTGELPARFPAGPVLLVAFLAITLLFRKAFCSWLCPIGTISEGLWKLGRRVFGRTFPLPRWVDWPLRCLKYLLLGFFLWAVGNMSVEAIRGFLASPYGLVADVKMLNFFRRMDRRAAIVIAVLLVGSVFVQNFWCRYLCPYGALLGLVSLFSPVRIRRDPDACIDCAKCAKACPSLLPVDRLHDGQVGRVHGLPRVRGRLPRRRRARVSAGRARAFPPGPSRPRSPRSSSASSDRAAHGPLALQRPRRGVPRAHAGGRRVRASAVGGGPEGGPHRGRPGPAPSGPSPPHRTN